MSHVPKFPKILKISSINLDVIRLFEIFWANFWKIFLENEFLPKLFEQDEHVTDSETSRTSFRFPSIKVF